MTQTPTGKPRPVAIPLNIYIPLIRISETRDRTERPGHDPPGRQFAIGEPGKPQRNSVKRHDRRCSVMPGACCPGVFYESPSFQI